MCVCICVDLHWHMRERASIHKRGLILHKSEIQSGSLYKVDLKKLQTTWGRWEDSPHYVSPQNFTCNYMLSIIYNYVIVWCTNCGIWKINISYHSWNIQQNRLQSGNSDLWSRFKMIEFLARHQIDDPCQRSQHHDHQHGKNCSPSTTTTVCSKQSDQLHKRLEYRIQYWAKSVSGKKTNF